MWAQETPVQIHPPTGRGNFMRVSPGTNPNKYKGECNYEGGCAAAMRFSTKLLGHLFQFLG